MACVNSEPVGARPRRAASGWRYDDTLGLLSVLRIDGGNGSGPAAFSRSCAVDERVLIFDWGVGGVFGVLRKENIA